MPDILSDPVNYFCQHVCYCTATRNYATRKRNSFGLAKPSICLNGFLMECLKICGMAVYK